MKAVVISDTHSREKKIEFFKDIPADVDMVIHAGDFSHSQKTHDEFLKWYSELDIKYKILVAGNHDEVVAEIGYNEMRQVCHTLGIIYLQDTGIEIEGVKFWGSPMSSEFGNWAFMKNDMDLYTQHWEKIPLDTNVLITHGPAYGKCDEVFQDNGNDNSVGSKSLNLMTGKLKDLKYHFVGHIHDSCGETHQDEHYTTYNACIMNFWYRPESLPSTFELKGI